MTTGENKPLLRLMLILALFALIELPTLGNISLWDIDAGRYLVPARNAIEHGKWLIPEYNGHPRIVKPPLMVWLVAASSLLLNKGKVNEFTARIPSVTAAFATLIVLFLLVRTYTEDEDLAIWSTFFLSTCLLFVKYTRLAVTDMVLLLFITSSIYALYMAVARRSPAWLIAGSALAGTGFLDKGPVAVIIPYAVILTYCYSERRLKRIPWKWLLAALVVLAVLCLWWPAIVGPAFWKEFILQSNLKRALSNPSWKTSSFFYLINFPAHFIMPSLLIPAAAFAMKRYRNPKITLFIVWFSVVFVLFSISDTKRSSYILPLYPAAATMVAYGFIKVKRGKTLKIIPPLCATVISGIFLWLFLLLVKHKAAYNWYIAAAAAYITSITAIVLLKRRVRLLIPLMCVLFASGYTNLYQPLADSLYHSPKRCIEEFKKIVGNNPVYIYGSLRANEYWYWGVRRIPKVDEATSRPFYFYSRRKKIQLPFPYRRVSCCTYSKEKICLYQSIDN